MFKRKKRLQQIHEAIIMLDHVTTENNIQLPKIVKVVLRQIGRLAENKQYNDDINYFKIH